MTGRRAGFCAGYDVPGYANAVPGYGRGMGYGRGRGYGRGPGFGRGMGRGRAWWGMLPDPGYGYRIRAYQGPLTFPQGATGPDERTYLEDMLQRLEEEMASVKKRLDEMGK
ncbi:MAG: DUF5320 domain-containing protein [Thermoplasmata archaeon]|nr:DUF5320 domain-containing protein [Thermoplasmata archaeon]